VRTALTIAGSDSGGGAGIQADLKTFTTLGVYGMSVITAITAQNTVGVRAVHDVPADVVAAQLDAVLGDIGADAGKTGMISNVANMEAVNDRLTAFGFQRLVVDPVMVAKSGDLLMQEQARRQFGRLIVPLATVLTPNLHEARVLTGQPVETLAQMREAAKRLSDLGPRYVLVKGGHLAGDPTDVLYDAERDEATELRGERIETRHTHGTGCTLSAAIAARLALGDDVPSAVAFAKRYTTEAIRHGLPLGRGHGPTDHIAAGKAVSR
jgi:hydroxymethylpyrimidine/phosphomethylpyrimidine kinase